MPPQGILLIAELIPKSWEVRFIDENIDPIKPEDFAWADVVFVSGMHIQRERIHDLTRRAHRAGRVVAFFASALVLAAISVLPFSRASR